MPHSGRVAFGEMDEAVLVGRRRDGAGGPSKAGSMSAVAFLVQRFLGCQ